MTVKDTLDILTYKKKFEEEKKEEKYQEEKKEEEKYKKKIFDYALKQYKDFKIKDEKQIKLGDNIDRLKQDYIASLIFLAFNPEKYLLGIREKGKATIKK